MEPRVTYPDLQIHPGVRNAVLVDRHSRVSFAEIGKKKYPSGAILHFDADLDPYTEQTGGVHTFNHAVLSPQYQRAFDGSYTDVGAKPAVDVYDGEKWLRSCGAVTNLLPSGSEDFLASVGWTITHNITNNPTTIGSVHSRRLTVINTGVSAYIGRFQSSFHSAPFFSVLVKKGNCDWVYFGFSASGDHGLFFNLATGVVGSAIGTAIGSIDALGGGVFRLHIWSSTAYANFVVTSARPCNGDGYYGVTAGQYVDVAQFQLTATSYPVPYVPPGVTQPASNATATNGSWFANPKYIDNVAGAGVGPCPESVLPPLMVPMEGCTDPLSPNYGSYTYDNVADMCFIPKFYYKANNTLGYTFGIHGANTLTIRGSETFASTAAANMAGFALHRAFIDGGIEHPGFFVDKYKCSKVAKGTGFVAGSVKNGLPISTASDHNPISEITSVSLGNMYASCIDAAKGRDGNNGVKNTSSIFAPISVYQRSALALFSLGYGEAADSNEYCAWYDPNGVTNFPKGCNNNALRDINDSQVVYQSDGYSNCGRTGSGVPFEKTTHNGQACGVCDLNGLMWEVSTGMTCIAATKSITGATQASLCVLTVPGHGLTTGRIIQVTSVVGMTQLNDRMYTVTVVDPDTISLDGVNSTGFTAYVSGGSIGYGNFYAAKEAARMRDFTSGTSLATDHWGATGVAAMMDEIALPLAAEPGGSSMTRYVGSGALSSDTSGLGYILTGIGHPKDVASLPAAGVDIFGKDYISQYFRDPLCVFSGGSWSHGSSAGVFARLLYHARGYAGSNVGLRCACYPDTINDPSATPPSILGSKVRSVSPLWSALAGDEVKGSPLTLATRVRMGVGSEDIPLVTILRVLDPSGSGAMQYVYENGVGEPTAGFNGRNHTIVSLSRGSIIRLIGQVNTAGTQFRSGYYLEGTSTAISWSDWAAYTGTLKPSTLYRLMLGFNNAYPMWYNKITAWKKQATDAEILEAMA